MPIDPTSMNTSAGFSAQMIWPRRATICIVSRSRLASGFVIVRPRRQTMAQRSAFKPDDGSHGRAYCETDDDEASIIENIIDGEYYAWWPSIPPKAGHAT